MTTSNIEIRKAQPSDLAAAEEVSRRAFEPLRKIYRPTKDHKAREREQSPKLDVVVALSEGQVVGTTRVRIDPAYYFVIGLAVDPDLRCRGIARSMLEWLANEAAETGRGLALATVRETGNVDIFRRLGFEVVKQEVATWCESDQFDVLHDVYMVREQSSDQLRNSSADGS